MQGVADLGIFHLLGQPNLNIKIDREKAARYGLNTGDVNTVVQAALGGTTATTVLEGDRQFSLAVRLDPKYRSSIDAIRTVKVAYQTPSGTNAYIPLSELADITLDTGASFIYRERSQRYIPIKFSVRGRDLGSTVAEAQERVAKAVKLPNGYRIIWAGEFEDLQNAKQRLLIVVPITLLLILVLLYGLFNSLRDSLLAVAGIPFAIGGGLIALYLAGLDFSVSAAIGFISLFGVAVMDGILNITYFRELRAQGMDVARSGVPRRRAAHAADADDGAVGRRRPVSGGDLARHRQPGAAAAGDRRRRRHVHRAVAAACRGAGAAQDIPVRREARTCRRSSEDRGCRWLASTTQGGRCDGSAMRVDDLIAGRSPSSRCACRRPRCGRASRRCRWPFRLRRGPEFRPAAGARRDRLRHGKAGVARPRKRRPARCRVSTSSPARTFRRAGGRRSSPSR